MTKTSINARDFAQSYLKHDKNGTNAYLEIKPHVTANTAATEACKLLKTPQVMEEINRIQERVEVKLVSSRADYIEKFEDIRNKAMESGSYAPAVSANKEAATLSGAYEREDDRAEKYNTFIGNLTVNVGSQAPDVVPDLGNDGTLEADWQDIDSNQGVTEQD